MVIVLDLGMVMRILLPAQKEWIEKAKGYTLIVIGADNGHHAGKICPMGNIEKVAGAPLNSKYAGNPYVYAGTLYARHYPPQGYSANRTNRKILLLLAAVTTSSSGLFSSGPLK